jgi:hypothetical protein
VETAELLGTGIEEDVFPEEIAGERGEGRSER